MADKLTIKAVAQRSGVPARTIRFYEQEGLLPPPRRSVSGYRLFAANDIRRLRLIRRTRRLGLSLPEVKDLVDQAFASECGAYTRQVLDLIARRQTAIDQRIAELHALRVELDDLAEDVHRAAVMAPAGQTVAECGRCPLVDDLSGEPGYCTCDGSTQAPLSASHLIPATGRGKEQLAMTTREDVLDILACEIEVRPKNAPGLDDVAGSVRGMHRDATGVVVTFDPAAAPTVEAFVAAEQQCCATLGWAFDTAAGRLTVTGTSAQLDMIEQLFARRAGD